jgi:hypothetical protein
VCESFLPNPGDVIFNRSSKYKQREELLYLNYAFLYTCKYYKAGGTCCSVQSSHTNLEIVCI